MTEKLDNLSKDIVTFLEKNEPNMLRWTEITEGLWPSYRFKYKDENGFGVALTRKLKFLKKEGLIKKEGVFYGSLKSKSFIEKCSTEEKPSEIEMLREDALKGTLDDVNRGWNRLILYADAHNLNPHPKALYNENMKKAGKASLGFMMVDAEEIGWKVRTNIIRYWLRRLAGIQTKT